MLDSNVPVDPNVSNAPSSDMDAPGSPDPTPQVTPQAATQPVNAPSPATQGSGNPPQGFVPSYRIREASEAAARRAKQELAQEIAAARAEADRYKTQLHSLVGATPQQNPEVAAIRDQFANIFPEEWQLLQQLKEKANNIFGLVDRAGDLEQSTNHYWTSYGRQTVDRLFGLAEDSLGSPL